MTRLLFTIAGGLSIAVALDEPRLIPIITALWIAMGLLAISGGGMGGPRASGGAA